MEDMTSTAPADNYSAPVADSTPQQASNGWLNNFSPEYREAVSKYGSIDGVAKSLLNAQSLLGKRTSEWKTSDAETYRNVMGMVDNVPSTADEYEFELRSVDDLGENRMTEIGINVVKQVSKEMGLTKEQGQQMYEVFNELELARGNEQLNSVAQDYERCLDTLSHQWGMQAEDKIQSMNNCVANVLPKLYGVSASDILNDLEAHNAYSSPVIMNMLATFGELVSEGRSNGYSNLSPMDAASRLESLKSDKEAMSILMNRRDPRYNQVRAELQSLIAQKHQQ